MATFIIGKSLKDDDVLWRYLSLDRYINLLATSSLYFSPLATYAKSDPFEGFMPKVAMEAIASVTAKSQERMLSDIATLEKTWGANADVEKIKELRKSVVHYAFESKETYKKIVSCMMVSCWNRTEHESEAMWHLYSKTGIAIKTTVGAIRKALEDNHQEHIVHIGAIKYLDFSNPELDAKGCVTDDGHIMGMIKRVAYAHENEVRMFITRVMAKREIGKIQPAPTTLSVNLTELIKAVVISPFASESLKQSIYAVTACYGLDRDLVTASPLLDACEYLLDEAYAPLYTKERY